jgi:hypothetical protein
MNEGRLLRSGAQLFTLLRNADFRLLQTYAGGAAREHRRKGIRILCILRYSATSAVGPTGWRALLACVGTRGLLSMLGVVNGNVLSLYARSNKFREALNHAEAVGADGLPVVIASRAFTSHPIPERCATTDFIRCVSPRPR